MKKVSNKTKEELIQKIIEKKEFSQLPKKDVVRVFNKFDKNIYSNEEKIKLSRDMLRKIFSGVTSKKIFSYKKKSKDWYLKRHLSTNERFNYYLELYKKILAELPKEKEISVIDLGAGINGFSYDFFKDLKFDIKYIAVEAIGQFVKTMNDFFKDKNIKGEAFHLSLFNLKEIKEIVKKTKKPRVVFLFKTIDSLEMLEKDYSKKFLQEITPLCERIVVSFSTQSMIKRKRFKAKRYWIINFINDNFKILEDFQKGGERYVVFCKINS